MKHVSNNLSGLVAAEDDQTLPKLQPIFHPYLLVTNVPVTIDAKGMRWTEAMWLKDLSRHVAYLGNLSLASPCRQGEPGVYDVHVSSLISPEKINHIDLPYTFSNVAALKAAPQNILLLWGALKKTLAVHYMVNNFPVPYGWLIVPMAKLLGRYKIIVIESAPWRFPYAKPFSKAKLVEYVFERVNRWCVNQSDFCLFTQADYKKQLLIRDQSKGYVIPASWIDESAILDASAAEKSWDKKFSLRPDRIRVLFAARLVEAKGVKVLLDAMQILADKGISSVELGIAGEGELLHLCESYAKKLLPTVHIKILGTREYGSDFFNLLKEYDAVVMPSLTDEQPRLPFDAYSQAVPVLASDTDGIRVCVKEGSSGRLVPPGDPERLSQLLVWAADNRAILRRMGIESLEIARGMTHWHMHYQRWGYLQHAMDQWLAKRR